MNTHFQTADGIPSGQSITADGRRKVVSCFRRNARFTSGGVTAAYLSGTEITGEGTYLLEFYDANGYSKTYAFTVDKAAPVGDLTDMANGITNKAVTLAFT
jgi:hypothetical protein